MTYTEIDAALVEIAREKCAACKARLDAVPRENPTERKALQLEYGMYTFCGSGGLLFNTTGERKIVQIRGGFLEKVIPKYPRLDAVYQTLGEEEKWCFLAALQAELFIREQWLDTQMAELTAAEEAGDIEKVFAYKIKIGAVHAMFDAWEAWRVENNVYPHMFQARKDAVQ